LLVAPHSLREPRGNSVTLARLASGLRRAGARVRLVGPDQADPRGRFDIVHAFHATKAGPRGARLARQSGAALVVTLTGTDVNQDLHDRSRGSVLRRVLEQAAVLIAFHAFGQAALRRSSKSWAAKTRVIPAAVAPPFFACGAGRRG
jgi:hypothetical protein